MPRSACLGSRDSAGASLQVRSAPCSSRCETLDVDVELARIVFFIALTAATNGFLLRHLRMDRPVSRTLCGAVLILDTVVLTALLQATGGPSNPFSVLYLVHITLAAVLLGRRLDLGAHRALGARVRQPVSLGGACGPPRARVLFAPSRHVARVHADGCAHGVVRRAPDVGDPAPRPRDRSDPRASRAERAAGGADDAGGRRGARARHAARRPSRSPPASWSARSRGCPRRTPSRCVDDARLIRASSSAAGDPRSDDGRRGRSRRARRRTRSRSTTSVATCVPSRAARSRGRARRRSSTSAARRSCRTARSRAAIASLVRNAFDASRPDGHGRGLGRAGRDALARHGHGPRPGHDGRRAGARGEPFFTTKPPGRGMGLGLFLARALARAARRAARCSCSTPRRGDRRPRSSCRRVLASRPRARPCLTRSASILLVDDDEVFRERLARAFRDRGFEVARGRRPRAERSARSLARGAAPSSRWSTCACPRARGSSWCARCARVDPATGRRRAHRLRQHRDRARGGAARRDALPDQAGRRRRHPRRVRARVRRRRAAAPSAEPDDVPSLARAEWEHINRVLADCGGNISEAARRLGIHRRSLQRKLGKRPVKR